jgi:hypothetical protein
VTSALTLTDNALKSLCGRLQAGRSWYVWSNTRDKGDLATRGRSLKDTCSYSGSGSKAAKGDLVQTAVFISGGALLCSGAYRPAARRAASSICAVPRTRTIAEPVSGARHPTAARQVGPVPVTATRPGND